MLATVTSLRSLRIPAAAIVAAALAAGAVAASSDASTFTPPKKLGAYVRFGDVKVSKTGIGLKQAKRHAAWDQKTASMVSAAYGGAQAISEDYSNEGLTDFALLVAVKAPSPKLWVPYSDPVTLGLVKPFQEVRTFGDVQCKVQNDPTVAGKKPAADSVHVVGCQRNGPHLTVQIQNVSGDHLGNHPETVAQMVDQAFNSLG
jgi:hypothetical protein